MSGRKIAVDKKLVKNIIDKGICSNCGGTLSYRVVEMGDCGKIMIIKCENCGDELVLDLEPQDNTLS